MVFKKFLKKALTLGISTSMLFCSIPLNIKAADTIDVKVITGKEKWVTINRENGGKIIVQLFPDMKYSKGLKQKLIGYILNDLKNDEELYFRYVFKDADGNITKSDWKRFENGAFTDKKAFNVEDEGTYEIQYALPATLTGIYNGASGLVNTETDMTKKLITSSASTPKASNGTLVYAVTTTKTEPASYTLTDVPTLAEAKAAQNVDNLTAGTVYVWYKVKGNTGYVDSAGKLVEVEIEKSGG